MKFNPIFEEEEKEREKAVLEEEKKQEKLLKKQEKYKKKQERKGMGLIITLEILIASITLAILIFFAVIGIYALWCPETRGIMIETVDEWFLDAKHALGIMGYK